MIFRKCNLLFHRIHHLLAFNLKNEIKKILSKKKQHNSRIDILLLQVPSIYLPNYFVGIASLKSFLTKNLKKAKCLEVFSLFYPHIESITNEICDENLEISSPHIRKILPELFLQIAKENPRFIGLSLISGNIKRTLYLSKQIKKQFPTIKIVLGGPAATKTYVSAYEDFDFIDYILPEEAEYSLLKLLSIPLRPHKVPGLIQRKGVFISSNSPSKIVEDLSEIPFPDYSDLENSYFFKKSFSNYLPVSFSRGCPFNCSFCTVSIYARKFRQYPVAQCIDLIETLNVPAISITDSICNGNPRWLKEFCQVLISKKSTTTWAASFRLASHLDDINTLTMIAKSNCAVMIFGLESGSEKVLRDMNKYHHLQTISNIFKKLKIVKQKYAISIELQLIVGYPSETEDDFKQTCQFIKDNHDVIDRILSCNSFILGERRDLIDSLKKSHQIEFDPHDPNCCASWSSEHSTPLIRINRIKQIESLFDRLHIPHNTFLNGLEHIEL